MNTFIRKMTATILIFSSLLLCLGVCGCDTSDYIEPGKYVCETPYITYTFDKDLGGGLKDEIELDGKVLPAHVTKDFNSIITYYSYQEEDFEGEGANLEDNEIYAEFRYSFDNRKHELILTDTTTGITYYLERVDSE